MPSSDADVVVVGAGAAGLLAARNLARAGRRVVVLEAQNRIGGRIHSLQAPGFSAPIEAGAEFIHGDAPLTKALLREAGVSWQATAGRTYEVFGGAATETSEFLADLPAVLEQLHRLPHDLPLAEFLDQYFPGPEGSALRQQVTQFAEGYNLADPARASAWALRDEWTGGGAEDSPRPVGGYAALLDWLWQQATAAGATLRLQTPVQHISWHPGQATVTGPGLSFTCRQVLLTVPVGVLQAEAPDTAALVLKPELPAYRAAARQLGFGAVIKVLLEFQPQASFPLLRRLPELGFVFSDAAVPTWWTQQPAERALLTGWLGGPAAARHQRTAEAELLTLALESLADVLDWPVAELRRQLVAHHIANWAAAPWARGAYSYATVETPAALQTLLTPVAETLFFAGEGIYAGAYTGTVEAALASGEAAAQRLLQRPPN